MIRPGRGLVQLVKSSELKSFSSLGISAWLFSLRRLGSGTRKNHVRSTLMGAPYVW